MADPKQNIVAHLAAMLEAANTAEPVEAGQLGRCEYIDPADPSGDTKCANLTEFQCSRIGGNWDGNRRC